MDLRIENRGGNVFDEIVDQTSEFFIMNAELPERIILTAEQKRAVIVEAGREANREADFDVAGDLTTVFGFPVIVNEEG